MEWIVLRKILAGFVLPPNGPLLCAALGLALIGWRPRLGKTLAWMGVGSLLALSLPAVSYWLVDAAGGGEALDLSRATTAQAIVITGAGVRRHAPEYGGQSMTQLTLERARYGAWLARKTALPVLVTGGPPPRARPEGDIMRNALQQEYSLAVRWAELRSRNTRENAQLSAAILLPEGVTRILLVTHAFDVRRARLEFEAAGFQVTPAPTLIRPRTLPLSVPDFVPSSGALHYSYYACYELLALLVRAFNAR